MIIILVRFVLLKNIKSINGTYCFFFNRDKYTIVLYLANFM